MNLNQLTTGTPQAFRKFATGQNVDTGSIIEGAYQISYSRGATPERWDVDVTMIAKLDAPAVGGQASGSHQSNEILARQIEELCGNTLYTGLNPVYIQWFAGGSVTPTQTPEDGWYIIESCASDYADTQFGIIRLKFKVVFLYAEGTPPVHTVSMWYGGGSRVTTYAGLATPWTPFPPGSTFGPSVDTTHRVGAEATIPFFTTTGTLPNPFYFHSGSTIATWFKGGCHIFDTINTGTYPVPTNTLANAQWVEVFNRKHVFSGDCVITNGLALVLIQLATSSNPTATCYAWDTTGSPQWRNKGTLYFRNATAATNLWAIGLQFIRIGPDDLLLRIIDDGADQYRIWVSMQRGEYAVDFGVQPLTNQITGQDAMIFVAATAQKIVANESNISDQATQGAGGLPPTGTYGWCVTWSATDNILSMMLWQKVPSTSQPHIMDTSEISFGDTGLTQNLIRWYSLAFVPLANTANLQAEAESGALGTGWTSGTTIAGYSGAGEAILASGTLSGNADLFGTSYVPAVGQYDVWMRVAVSARTSAVGQWQMGLWDTTSAAFVASTTYAPNNAVFTANNTWIWVRVATNVTPTATHNMQFRVVTTATTDTVLYVDQAALVPKTSSTWFNFPQDVWQQDMWGTKFTVNHHS